MAGPRPDEVGEPAPLYRRGIRRQDRQEGIGDYADLGGDHCSINEARPWRSNHAITSTVSQVSPPERPPSPPEQPQESWSLRRSSTTVDGRSRYTFHRTRPKQSSSPATVRKSRSGADCSCRPTYGPQ